VFTLIISYIISLIYKTKLVLSQKMLIGYFIIVMGSILPVTHGKLKILIKPEFWKQKFILFVVISEMSYGVYTSLVSSFYTDNHGENFESFIISRMGFILVFCIFFVTSYKMRNSIFSLKYVSKRLEFIFLY
jgi:hypothetical protein